MTAILNYANHVGIFYTDKFIQHAGNLKSQRLVMIPESSSWKSVAWRRETSLGNEDVSDVGGVTSAQTRKHRCDRRSGKIQLCLGQLFSPCGSGVFGLGSQYVQSQKPLYPCGLRGTKHIGLLQDFPIHQWRCHTASETFSGSP